MGFDNRLKLMYDLAMKSATPEEKKIIKNLLEEIMELKKPLKRFLYRKEDSEFYYSIDENGKEDGPFCPLCKRNEEIVVPLELEYGGGSIEIWKCNRCKQKWD